VATFLVDITTGKIFRKLFKAIESVSLCLHEIKHHILTDFLKLEIPNILYLSRSESSILLLLAPLGLYKVMSDLHDGP